MSEIDGKLRVMLVDDHALVRSAVRQALTAPDVEFVGEAANAAEAMALAPVLRPDILLLDIDLPGMNGIQLVQELAPRLPQTKIVMLTVSRADEDLFGSLRAGASAYLLKDADAETLPDTLLRVLAGEAPIPPSLVARMVEQFRGSRIQRRRTVTGPSVGQPLTSREWEVLELLYAGHSTRQIAARLVVSQSAVRSHIGSILRKLRVPDRASALRLLDEHATDRQT
jgi:DNA-binding NarL/FixJ family response regulator